MKKGVNETMESTLSLSRMLVGVTFYDPVNIPDLKGTQDTIFVALFNDFTRG